MHSKSSEKTHNDVMFCYESVFEQVSIHTTHLDLDTTFFIFNN